MIKHPYIVEEIVSKEVAVMAKELGFDVPTLCYYHPTYGLSASSFHEHEKLDNMNSDHWAADYYSAPTHETLAKWLRKEHNVDICISPYHNSSGYSPSIYKDKLSADELGGYPKYDEYEEAYDIGLNNALHLLLIQKRTRDDV